MSDEEDVNSRPASAAQDGGSRPASSKSAGSVSASGSRPSSSRSASGSRPGSGKAWDDDPENVPVDPEDPQKGNDEDELIREVDEDPPKGCWWRFTTCLGGMWATREMHRGSNREILVRTTIRELIVYSIFLIILCVLTFGMTSATMFYYTRVMTGLFKKAAIVSQVDEFWEFMESDLLDGLYWEYLYNDGNDKNFVCPGGEEAVGPCPVAPADRNILYENRLLGLPRLRQLRVKNDSCTVHSDFQNAIKQCYDSYSSSIEDTDPFGNGYRKKTSADAWRYRTEDDLGGSSHSGILASYSGAGSVQDLHSLKNESAAIIKELKEGLWVTRGTRYLSVDFTVYNANINLFCIVTITFEYAATGGIMPELNFRTVKLLRYVTPGDYFILACELIFVCFIFYYIVEEILEARKQKLEYFNSLWNFLDMIVIGIACVCIAFSVYTYFSVQDRLDVLLADPDQFADFGSLGSLAKSNSNAIAICVFFAWIKLFKYISFNKTMTQLSSTLSRSAKDVAGFGVMFFIVFFAFAQLGFLLFGTQVKDFSSFSDAIFTLLRTILGDFDFHAIEQANRLLGPIFFLSYVFFVFFVLLNMFLAIINDTYSEVKAEIAGKRNDFELGDYVKRGYNNMLGAVGSRDKAIDIEHAMKLATASSETGGVTYDELRQNLKKANFSDMEIEMFFARYDKDGKFQYNPDEDNDQLRDPEEIEEEKRKEADLQRQEGRPLSGRQAREQRSARIRSAMSGRAGGSARRASHAAVGNIGGEEFGMLSRRVDRMELSIGSIVSKIDAVLGKLEGMDRGRARRKQTMNKILGSITEDSGADDATRRQKMEELVRKELENWDDSRPGTGK